MGFEFFRSVDGSDQLAPKQCQSGEDENVVARSRFFSEKQDKKRFTHQNEQQDDPGEDRAAGGAGDPRRLRDFEPRRQDADDSLLRR